MSLSELSNYTFKSRYAKYNPLKERRENWSEVTDRVFDMHKIKFAKELENEEFKEAFDFAKQMVKEKRVFGSQRALQYAVYPILNKNSRLFNCTSTYIDRPRVFAEVLFMLLSGCGVGISVQKRHINKLPIISKPDNCTNVVNFVIEDSIEGWADAIDELMEFYYDNGRNNQASDITFDYSLIRKRGSHINGGFKAPGPEPLEQTINIIKDKLDSISKEQRQLKSIEAYDIIMHISDAVISGGIRRAAAICIFDRDDIEMIEAKSKPFWWEQNPQRMRSNNSVIIKRDEIDRNEFKDIFQRVKNYGEPGFIFVDNYDVCVNPCCEISLIPMLYDENGNHKASGFSCCNLTEIIGSKCKTKEDFYLACKAGAIIGTMQAAYTDFEYLGPVSEEIAKRDALLGVSVTGWQDSPEVLFDPNVEAEGARIVKETNIKIAKLLNINPAKRLCTTKPSGSTSILAKTGSGIHPHHARRYIRRVQSNKDEFCYSFFKKYNPHAIEEKTIGSRNNIDSTIMFPCEVPSGAIVKNQLSAIQFLEQIKVVQDNWIKNGVNQDVCEEFEKNLTHNISNTVTVKQNEWEEVEEFIFNNRDSFCGISLLASSGDLDYKQAPFTTIHTPMEIVKEYGDGSVMASGVICAGLMAYEDDLWTACNDLIYNQEIKFEEMNLQELQTKIDWIKQAKRFADKYIDGDYKRMTYLLKDVCNWKLYCDLKRDWQIVPWNEALEEVEIDIDVDTMVASACSGGKCEIDI